MDDKGEFAARRRPGGWGNDADTGGVMAARSVPQPPLSTDLLADLHADNVPAEQAEMLWRQVRRDPAAAGFLHSLDGVSAELRALGADDRILHPMPAPVAARMDALLDDLAGAEPSGGKQSQQVATVHHLHTVVPYADSPDSDEPPSTRPLPALAPVPPDRPGIEATRDMGPLSLDPADDRDRFAEPDAPAETYAQPVPLDHQRTKRLRWFTAAAAAVAVIAGSLVAVDAVRDRDVSPDALPASESNTIALGDELSSSTVLSAMGRHDVTGRLAASGAIAGCIEATVPDRTILGSTNVTYHGEPAVLILLTGPQPPEITALVVGTGCSAADPQVLETRDIG